MSGIVVHELRKTYSRGLAGPRVRALDGVSLAIRPGECFGVIGPNGAGKTTLFGCLLGFLRPDAGHIAVDGHAPDDLEIRAVTGYLPERLVADRWMTGRAFLAYHHALAGLPAEERDDAVEAGLARVGLDRGAAQRPVRKYSRGMLQRLGLAQAMLGRPRWLFLDEPAAGVDPAGVVLIRRLLGELKAEGVGIVMNSHQLDQVERVCDRVAFVRQGRVEATETVEAGAAHARVLRVRLRPAAGGAEPEALAAIARPAGAELVRADGTEARFSVTDDEGAARLVAALVAAGHGVVQAVPEESRLERLFLEARPAAPGTPPAAPGTGPGGGAA